MSFGLLFTAACIVVAAEMSMVYLEIFKPFYVHVFQGALILGSVLCCLKLYAEGVEALVLGIFLAFAVVLLLWGSFWLGRLAANRFWQMMMTFIVVGGSVLSTVLRSLSGAFDVVFGVIVMMTLAVGCFYYTLSAAKNEAQAV